MNEAQMMSKINKTVREVKTVQADNAKLQTGEETDLTNSLTWTAGGFWRWQSGTVQAMANVAYSAPVTVTAGEKYKISGSYYWSCKPFVLSDSADKTVAYYVTNSAENISGKINDVIITIPYGATKMRLNKYTGTDANILNAVSLKKIYSYTSVKQSQGQLYGKFIAFIGDSITRGYGNNGISYPEMIKANEGCLIENRAIDGATLANGTTANMKVCTDITNMAATADCVVFSGGINDWNLAVPLGTLDTTGETRFTAVVDVATFAGALDSIFRQAIVKWPKTPKLFVITHPIQNSAYTNNTITKTYLDYYALIVAACEKYAIPTVDLFKNSGFNCHIATLKNDFTWNPAGEPPAPDGCHPNEAGYRHFYVPQITNALKKIML